MVVLLAVTTSTSISALEWLRFFSLSRIYLKEVSVQGNHRVSSADIIDASNLRVGIDNIYSIEPYVAEKRIKARFRYVEQIRVRQRMDALVNIEVKEREPVALVTDSVGAYCIRPYDSFVVVDNSGFILEKSKKQDIESLRENTPVIAGVKTSASEGILKNSVLGLALDVINAARSVGVCNTPLQRNFHLKIVDARDPDDIILVLKIDDGKDLIIRIASDRIREGLLDARCWMQDTAAKSIEQREKIPALRSMLSAHLASSIQCIDARFSGAIYYSNQ